MWCIVNDGKVVVNQNAISPDYPGLIFYRDLFVLHLHPLIAFGMQYIVKQITGSPNDS